MRLSELSKYSDGTIKLIKDELINRLVLEFTHSTKIIDAERVLIETTPEQLELLEEWRDGIRRYQKHFGFAPPYF